MLGGQDVCVRADRQLSVVDKVRYLTRLTELINMRLGTNLAPRCTTRDGHRHATHARFVIEGGPHGLVIYCERSFTQICHELAFMAHALDAKGPPIVPRPLERCLQPEQVREVRARAEAGVSAKALAETYAVDPRTIQRIVRRETWKDLV